MTNAEKFLKEGVDVKQFAEMIDTAYIKADLDADVCESTINWLNKQVKPTLTEDEKVILRNLQNVRYIGRTEGTGYLYATFNTIDNYSNRSDITDIDLYFSKMFPFIKERRRI